MALLFSVKQGGQGDDELGSNENRNMHSNVNIKLIWNNCCSKAISFVNMLKRTHWSLEILKRKTANFRFYPVTKNRKLSSHSMTALCFFEEFSCTVSCNDVQFYCHILSLVIFFNKQLDVLLWGLYEPSLWYTCTWFSLIEVLSLLKLFSKLFKPDKHLYEP